MGGRLWRLTVAVTVVALLGTPVADSQMGPSTATYRIHEDEGTISYSETGPTMPAIQCESGWYKSWKPSTLVVPESIHKLVVRIDEVDHDVSITHWEDGIAETTVYGCADAETRPTAPTIGWHSRMAATGGHDSLMPEPLAGACDGDPALSVGGMTPFRLDGTVSASAPENTLPLCSQARAAAEVSTQNHVPFTGYVEATLTDGDDQQLWAQTCLVVFGTCWNEGAAELDASWVRSGQEKNWTLTCEASPPFAAQPHAVGSFSCRAWLG